MKTLRFQRDDLTGEAIRALVIRHLSGMHEHTPPESVHAYGFEKLQTPDVRLWSAWAGEELAGMGALRRIDEANGELKSMRVADPWLGRGIGRAILDHLIAIAAGRGLKVIAEGVERLTRKTDCWHAAWTWRRGGCSPSRCRLISSGR